MKKTRIGIESIIIDLRIYEILFSKRQENRDRGWNWGRKGKGEAGSLKRFFRVSRRFEILKRAATASGDMALVHT